MASVQRRSIDGFAPSRELAPRQWESSATLMALLVAATVVAVYAPALRGGFVWDDDVYITGNRLLWEPDGLWRIWFTRDFASQYFPLTITVLRGAYQLWGFDTLGYHLLNVGIHLVNALLVWRLLGRLWVPGAGVAAAIFALHPVQVESVAWMTELKNLLSTTFYLLAVWAYLRFDDGKRVGWYLAALLLFVAGLLSKTVVCTLPGVLLILRWWQKQEIGGRDVARLAPFFAVGFGMGLFVAWYEVSHIGTVGREFDLSFSQRVLIASRALWFYVGKLAFPTGLAFSYPRWELDPRDPVQWTWLAGFVGVATVLWVWRHRIGRGPAAGLACFAVVLSPMLGFVDYYTMRYSFVADHYQYLACLGPIAAVTAGVRTRIGRRAGGMLATAVLAVLAVLSWKQAHTYRSPEALWHHTLEHNPRSWMGHNNLGNWLVERGALDEALGHYETSRRLNPDYGDPYNNIGLIMVQRGHVRDAIPLFRRAIVLDPGNADFHYNLGTALGGAGREDEAIAVFEHALRLVPGHHATHNNLANILAERGELTDAVAHYRAAAESAPDNADVRENLADTLAALGQNAAAAVEYRAAIRLAPRNADLHMGLAEALAALGERDAAIHEYERAVAAEPDAVHIRYNLGVQLAAAGRTQDAVVQYREVLRRIPGHADAANNLGVALRSLGQMDEAIDLLRTALRAVPEDLEIRYNLAVTLHQQGRLGNALEVAEDGLGGAPDDARLANLVAWIRATAPEARWRDAREAVQLAEHVNALTGHGDPNYLDTLAAAYAAAGRFADAARTARRALGLLAEMPGDAGALRSRLALYEAEQPFREAATPGGGH